MTFNTVCSDAIETFDGTSGSTFATPGAGTGDDGVRLKMVTRVSRLRFGDGKRSEARRSCHRFRREDLLAASACSIALIIDPVKRVQPGRVLTAMRGTTFSHMSCQLLGLAVVEHRKRFPRTAAIPSTIGGFLLVGVRRHSDAMFWSIGRSALNQEIADCLNR